ncbi:MAG: helix-turn-helix domain-containing protein [Planctomycetes bacterium]|nr:helix-turn-helix domain-containing protein [Planctomycetota bacterium]
MMDLEQVANYLQRDAREVSKLASRGHLPGRKISGEWRFARTEINYWIETQLHDYTDEQLTALEDTSGEPLVCALLSEATMAVPLPAGTRASVLKELVNLAEQTWQVYDPEAIHTAIRQREDMGSTALTNGVAIPHPRRPLPAALGESVIAFGRTGSAIPFGGDHGCLTDIFFLVCCRDHKTHLGVLARLARMMLRDGFVAELRAAESVAEAYRIIANAEGELLS